MPAFSLKLYGPVPGPATVHRSFTLYGRDLETVEFTRQVEQFLSEGNAEEPVDGESGPGWMEGTIDIIVGMDADDEPIRKTYKWTLQEVK